MEHDLDMDGTAVCLLLIPSGRERLCVCADEYVQWQDILVLFWGLLALVMMLSERGDCLGPSNYGCTYSGRVLDKTARFDMTARLKQLRIKADANTIFLSCGLNQISFLLLETKRYRSQHPFWPMTPSSSSMLFVCTF